MNARRSPRLRLNHVAATKMALDSSTKTPVDVIVSRLMINVIVAVITFHYFLFFITISTTDLDDKVFVQFIPFFCS